MLVASTGAAGGVSRRRDFCFTRGMTEADHRRRPERGVVRWRRLDDDGGDWSLVPPWRAACCCARRGGRRSVVASAGAAGGASREWAFSYTRLAEEDLRWCPVCDDERVRQLSLIPPSPLRWVIDPGPSEVQELI